MLVGIIDYDILIDRRKLFVPKIEVMLCSGYHKKRGDIVHLIMDNRDLSLYQKVYLWRDYTKVDKKDAFNFSTKDPRIEFHGRFYKNQIFIPTEDKFFQATPDPSIYNPYVKKIQHTDIRRRNILSQQEFVSLRKNELGYGQKKKLVFYDYDLGSQEDLDRIKEISQERKEKGIFWRPITFSQPIRCDNFETALDWARQDDFNREIERVATNISYLGSVSLEEIKQKYENGDFSDLKNRVYTYLTVKNRFKTDEDFDAEFIKGLDKITYCMAHKIKIYFTLPPTIKLDEEYAPFRELVLWNVGRDRVSFMSLMKKERKNWTLNFLERHPEYKDKINLDSKGLALLSEEAWK